MMPDFDMGGDSPSRDTTDKGSRPPPPMPSLSPTSKPTISPPSATKIPTLSRPESPTVSPTMNQYWTLPPTSSPTLVDQKTNSEWVVPSLLQTKMLNEEMVEWDCSSYIVRFESTVSVSFIGSPQDLSDVEVSALERTFESVYNLESLMECDSHVRTILHSKLQEGSNGYEYVLTATCRDCPLDTSLFEVEGAERSGIYSKFVKELGSGGDYFERMFFGKSWKQNSENQALSDTCVCPASNPPESPQAPTVNDFLRLQNEALIELRKEGIITSIQGISNLTER